MSFWDNVKKFTQPYSNDEYDEDYDEEMDQFEEQEEEEIQQPAPRGRRSSPFASHAQESAPAATTTTTATASGFGGQVLNMGSGKQEVILFHAKTFDDAAHAADELRKKKAVILNMENVDKSLTRRVVDFLTGSVYALDGRVKKIAQATYLFCPHNMEVVGDLEGMQIDSDSIV